MDFSHLIDSFERYLRSPTRDQALLVSGAWGSGKTHFFQTEMQKVCKDAGFKVLYVSVNGVKDGEALDRALFVAAYPLVKSGLFQATGALVRSVLSYAKVSIDDLLKIEAAITDGTLVCLDDFERADPAAIRALMARVADLLESKQAKVLILCDESKLDSSDEYRNGKEKIVGRSLSFMPSHRDIAEIAAKTISKTLAKYGERLKLPANVAETSKEILSNVLIAADCRNMRLSISALNCFVEFVSAAPLSVLQKHGSGWSRLFRTCVATVIQLGKDPGSRAYVERVFALGENGLSYPEAASANGRVAREFLTTQLEDPSYPPLLSHELFKFIVNGTCDWTLIDQQLTVLLAPNVELDPPKLLQRYRRITQGEFDAAMSAVLRMLDDSDWSLDGLNELAKTLFHLSEKNLVPLGKDALQEKFMRAGRRAVDLAKRSGLPSRTMDQTLPIQPSNPHHQRVFDNLVLFSQDIERQNQRKSYLELFNLIDSDPSEFAARMADLTKPFARGAILTSDQDVSIVAQNLSNAFVKGQITPEGLAQLATAFTRRYLPHDMQQVVLAEREFLSKLLNEIRGLPKLIGESNSLARSAFAELFSAIEGALKPGIG